MKYDIIQGKPPVWERIKQEVPGATSIDQKKIWITCGDKIYSESPIPKEILEHELIHVKQQTIDMTAEEWWDRWFDDIDFRYAQELPGYRRQVQVAAETLKDRNKIYRYKRAIAEILSGPIYGHIKTFNEVIADLS